MGLSQNCDMPFFRFWSGEKRMKFRVPSYYKKFQCIAGACRHSCCIGWEVDIDEDTASYYKSVKGALGERMEKYMMQDEAAYFALEENGWCPFLNQQKLCDICIELGEEALSEVCTEYPRFTMEYGNVREKILSLSCEEVGRLVFSTDEKITWQEWEMPGDIEGWDEAAEETKTGEAAETQVTAQKLEQVRARAVELLQDRTKPVFLRAAEYLNYCRKMQQELFAGVGNGRGEWDAENVENTGMAEKAAYENFRKRLERFEQLEVLDETWTQVKRELYETFSEENYLPALKEYLASDAWREYEYEHLLVYFTFRYFMRAFYDDNLLSKAQFAVLSVLMIRDIDVARYLKNDRNYTLEDRIDNVRIYSREVEHSEENMELLEEDTQFEKVFEVESLKNQLLITE